MGERPPATCPLALVPSAWLPSVSKIAIVLILRVLSDFPACCPTVSRRLRAGPSFCFFLVLLHSSDAKLGAAVRRQTAARAHFVLSGPPPRQGGNQKAQGAVSATAKKVERERESINQQKTMARRTGGAAREVELLALNGPDGYRWPRRLCVYCPALWSDGRLRTPGANDGGFGVASRWCSIVSPAGVARGGRWCVSLPLRRSLRGLLRRQWALPRTVDSPRVPAGNAVSSVRGSSTASREWRLCVWETTFAPRH
ncbi:hypothetical protein TraAM80_01325 [Trypanosoma rangeli]|uniref:Uncharacterized protein n=1 Tax=Trypanosoma rangeli TaxID=5698 RepID=A0A422NZ96_TRYRA|nr:uncharacterized protein TraAM80_01325 [Trypanosoma rangeli]RNF10764.1 hypothetical protein TraAM80_01325 [Trypanosoma rangeli]|eukprot:RNF10764.1 hypothetical protein TraAM80_01325 [Trypanosoma rangeli]